MFIHQGELTIKTTCPNCGKKKAIKKKVFIVPKEGVHVLTKKGCHKCKWKP